RVAIKPLRNLVPQSRYRLRKLVRSARSFTEPERNSGSHPVCVLNPHDAALDALDLVAPVAKLEYVAGKAFDGKILVHCSDEVVFRLEQHLIIGILGDGAPCRQGGQSRSAAPAQDPIDG